ncbi:hypothetical protein [Synechococcus sp. BA-132 BA5]|nr:hypothetical protein [Synechococcus sp. BA-132 BA5]
MVLSDEDVQQLLVIAGSRSLPHSIVQRAQIALACVPVKPTPPSPSEWG